MTYIVSSGALNSTHSHSNPQKALPWRERRTMTYWALGCVQRCDNLWAWLKRGKKDRNFRASNWLFAQTTTSTYPLKFCIWGRVLELVIYFKFHENRSRGLGAVGGRKSPSSIDLAHGLYNSLYYRTSRDTWNKLPASVIALRTLSSFKTLLDQTDISALFQHVWCTMLNCPTNCGIGKANYFIGYIYILLYQYFLTA